MLFSLLDKPRPHHDSNPCLLCLDSEGSGASPWMPTVQSSVPTLFASSWIFLDSLLQHRILDLPTESRYNKQSPECPTDHLPDGSADRPKFGLLFLSVSTLKCLNKYEVSGYRLIRRRKRTLFHSWARSSLPLVHQSTRQFTWCIRSSSMDLAEP